VTGVGSVEYAHARLWARNGERPNEAAWRCLEVVREFPALLDTARQLPEFRSWVAGIAAPADVHEIEAKLRSRWRTLVSEVAGWMPDAWQPAVRWCAVLVDVPVVQYLARGGVVLPWIERDPLYRDLKSDRTSVPPAALGTGMLAPLAQAWHRPDDLAVVWRDEWSRRVPRDAFADSALLHDLERAFETHFRMFGEATIRDGWPLRRALQARLLAMFRRAMLNPIAAVIWLALCALDCERLRGELLHRAAFPRLRLAT
jgi:hypothetical protein